MDSELKRHVAAMARVWGNPMHRFLLDHGRDYPTGPHSFSMPRGKPQACYQNSTHLALDLPHLTYVEGYVTVYGVPINHAWCIDEEGVVVDVTIDRAISGGGTARIGEYFGVPFRADYVRKAAILNAHYGLLDPYYNRKTVTKLIELGLDQGQQWLLDRKRSKA